MKSKQKEYVPPEIRGLLRFLYGSTILFIIGGIYFLVMAWRYG